MATAKELLAIARKELGTCENPPSSNQTKYGKWYGLDGQPWCMMFVQWCFAQAGVKLPLRTASCGELMRAAKAANCWIVRDFQPGDVVIYDFPGGAATDHCGIVEMELPDYVDSATAASSGCAEFNRARPLDGAVARSVQAIEGNTSQSGSQSNGGMVCRKNRPRKYIVGAVRPQFDKEDEDMDINTMLAQMTDKQAYELLVKAQRHAAALTAPDWAQAELQEAVAHGITDGTRPMELIPRYQAAIMAKRAAVK